MDLQTFLNDFMNKDDLALLVRDAAELFECPAMVVDMAFHVIAWHCDADFNDAPFRTSLRMGSLTYEAGSLLAVADTQAQLVSPQDSPYKRRFSLLMTGGAPVGYLILVDIGERLEHEDYRVFQAVESALAKQLMLEASRGSSVRSAEESVLQHLLEGRFTDESLFTLQAEAAGLKYLAPRRIALVNLELYHSANWSENALRSTILDGFPMSRPLVHDGNVVFFLNSDPDMGLFRNLSRQFSLRVVISAPVGRLFRLPVAQLGCAADRLCRCLSCDPVELPYFHPGLEQVGAVPQRNGIGSRIDRADEYRLSPGVAQTLALPDRIVDQTFMGADGMPLQIHESAGLRSGSASVPLHDLRIIAVRHEADVLAVRLIRVHKAVLRRDAPRLLLCIFPQGEQRVRQLLLSEAVQHIALVLGRIEPLFQQKSAVRTLLDAGVMPGHDLFAAKFLGPVVQLAEL